MIKIQSHLETEQSAMLTLLERLVNIDSGSYYKHGIDRCGSIIADEISALGFEIEIIREKEKGNHIKCKRRGLGSKQLLILAHLDTVWPKGTTKDHPFRLEGNLAYGPGVGDMKGGIVMMLFALKALLHLGIETVPIAVFLTGDEELGSMGSRRYIEEEGKRSEWVFVMEGAVPPYTIVTRRWGVGAFKLILHGEPAHVLDPKKTGINACSELAHKIFSLEEITDFEKGVIVSVNRVSGGSARQVTAGTAVADIDVRVKNLSEMDSVESQVKKIASTPTLPGIRIELEGKMTRPPMVPGKKTDNLLSIILDVGSHLGVKLLPGEKAGGSDGSFTASLGVPTIDGMGPVGYDMCSDTESIDITSIVSRTCILAESIRSLPNQKN